MSRMNWSKGLVLATAGVGVVLVGFGSSSAQAASLTYDFAVNVGSGELVGKQYNGFLTFDDANITGVGAERINPSQGLAVSFNFLGRNYAKSNDLGFPDYPIIDFFNGSLQGLSFLVLDNALNPNLRQFAIGSSTRGSDAGGTYFIYGTSDFSVMNGEGSVSYKQRNTVPVPTPALLPGLIGLGMAAFRKRNQDQSMSTDQVL